MGRHSQLMLKVKFELGLTRQSISLRFLEIKDTRLLITAKTTRMERTLSLLPSIPSNNNFGLLGRTEVVLVGVLLAATITFSLTCLVSSPKLPNKILELLVL